MAANDRVQEGIRAALGDPSALTTQQLWREVQHLKELFESKITGLEDAAKLAHEDMVRVPTEVQKAVGNLRELHAERFESVEARFRERDMRFDLEAQNSKSAVSAAFQAAKEANEKSEVGFAKQIDGLTEMFQTSMKALEGKIDDVKDRLTKVESKAEGKVEEVKTQHASGSHTFGIVSMIVGVTALIASIVIGILK